MSKGGWAREFDEPIPAGKRKLVSLRDAGEFITALSAKEAQGKHWQLAMECLIYAADRGGIIMLADIAMRRALNAGKPEPPEPGTKRAKAYKIVR